MSEFAPARDGRDVGPQRGCLWGEDAACLDISQPRARGSSLDFNHSPTPSPFASSGRQRVQWGSMAHVMRLPDANRVN